MIGSIEEKVIELQARKRTLADALFDADAKTAADITEADVELLFAA